MNMKVWAIFSGLCMLLVSALCAVPSGAQTTEVKPKPTMYSYVANWQIPRAQWKEMETDSAQSRSVMEKALADGTIVGYGYDENLVHTPDGETHDDWWSSMSMAGIVKVLDRLQASGSSGSSVLTSATKHWDLVFESEYYNWKPGAYKNGYITVSSYQLKHDAPRGSIGLISRTAIAPLMEKLLAEGTIVEYEIDVLSIHTSAPGYFSIVSVTPTPEGLDKVNAAIEETLKAQPLISPAFGAMVEPGKHRDELLLGSGAYK